MVCLEPTFLAIRRLLPSSQLLKMRYYYEDYGGLKCGKANVAYRSNGFRGRCKVVEVSALFWP